jgi:hypothetical protein
VPTEPDIDQLYRPPPDQFTAARNTLAKRLKAEGDREAATKIASLVKPNVSSWAVNQIYWRDRRVFDALLDAGEQLRKAQSARLAGRRSADLQKVSRERQEAFDAALKSGFGFLREIGSANPAMRDRIARTLEALGAYGRSSPDTARGRLTADLDPPGFEALAALAGTRSTAPPLRLVKPAAASPPEPASAGRSAKGAGPRRAKTEEKRDRQETQRERARRAKHAAQLREARSRLTRDEAALRLRRSEDESASGRHEEALKTEREAAADLERARRTLDEAEKGLQRARAAVRESAARSKGTAAALQRAERTAGAARAEVEELERRQ